MPKKNKSEEVIRAPLPNRENEEMMGIVEEMLGYGWMLVRCEDGKIRKGRIRGKYHSRGRMWVKVGDIVIVKPWEVMKDRVDVLYRYRPAEREWLRMHGYLKWLEEVPEEEEI